MILGIEIGGTKLQVVLGDEAGKIGERRRLHVDPAKGAAGIRGQIEKTVGELTQGHRILRAGVGFGGPVDWKTGRICISHHVEGWSGFDMAGWLSLVAGAPVVVENDANTAALGEALRGAGVGYSPVFYVTLGSGVGGGLVVDGSVYHGAKPGEAEIGHVRLDRNGMIVEGRCSGWAVDRRIRELKEKEPQSLLAKLVGQVVGGEAKHLTVALQQGDPAAERLLREITDDLAFGLSHVVHLFHPEIIILGGGLSKVGELLRAGVESGLQRFMMEAFLPGPKVVLAALGEDAVPVGALLLAENLPDKRHRMLDYGQHE
jgi:glucokinase